MACCTSAELPRVPLSVRRGAPRNRCGLLRVWSRVRRRLGVGSTELGVGTARCGAWPVDFGFGSKTYPRLKSGRFRPKSGEQVRAGFEAKLGTMLNGLGLGSTPSATGSLAREGSCTTHTILVVSQPSRTDGIVNKAVVAERLLDHALMRGIFPTPQRLGESTTTADKNAKRVDVQLPGKGARKRSKHGPSVNK